MDFDGLYTVRLSPCVAFVSLCVCRICIVRRVIDIANTYRMILRELLPLALYAEPRSAHRHIGHGLHLGHMLSLNLCQLQFNHSQS